MGIWSKLWNQFQNSNRVSFTITDSEGKLINLPELLNWTLKDLLEITEENSKSYVQKIEDKIQEINQQLKQKNLNETDQKQLQNIKFQLLQCQKIISNNEYLLNYLLEYKYRLKTETFLTQDGIIDIYQFFQIKPDANLEELNTAKQNLENQAYLLEKKEKHEKIDQINKYYEILIDPISRYGYQNMLKNPETISLLDQKIEKLKGNQETKTKEQPEKMENKQETMMAPDIESLEDDPDFEIIDLDEYPKKSEPTKPIETATNIESLEDDPDFEIIDLEKQETTNSKIINLREIQNRTNTSNISEKPTAPKELKFLPIVNLKSQKKIAKRTQLQKEKQPKQIIPPQTEELNFIPIANHATRMKKAQEDLQKMLEQKNHLEELLIPNLSAINHGIIELQTKMMQSQDKSKFQRNLNLLYISKESIIFRHQKELMNNQTYQNILKNIKTLNEMLSEPKVIHLSEIDPDKKRKTH